MNKVKTVARLTIGRGLKVSTERSAEKPPLRITATKGGFGPTVRAAVAFATVSLNVADGLEADV